MVPLTAHGAREMLVGSVVLALIGLALGWILWPLALIVLPFWIFLFAFFRDPERSVPAEQHIMVSPADGTVSDIVELEHDELLGGPAVRIGIFLSVFSVHINRAPCDGKITDTRYKKGKFINALNHAKASDQNECNTVVIASAADGRPVAVVKQIVGLIARRIVCAVKPGDLVQRGQRIGMIKFGSRTELYIPKWLDPEVRVKVGQPVRGAADIIAVMRKPVPAVSPEAAKAGA